MTEHSQGRWIERAVVSVVMLVVIATVVQTVSASRARRRDASQMEALRQSIAQIAEASAHGQFVCSLQEMRVCQAEDVLRSCAIFSDPCDQRSVVARTVFQTVPATTRVTSWQDAAHFQIEFRTEGSQVAGLEPGNEHLADQNGILR